jgi:hypothetical protein
MKETKLEKRVTSLEGVNIVAGEKERDDSTIGIKEVFAKTNQLEGKIDMIIERHNVIEGRSIETTRKFTGFVYAIFALIIADIILSVISIYVHWRLM